ncbi:DNA methylase [Micromonospora palomenae]|uniref:DNA methylase n=1 Tax=Micromonospora palomenae TaxID=1461247 RepID=A0A561WCF0_9ACTN|nr:DNA methyltransferase [Micromonospora palomenae]TWG21527.1 DNA methylase [Micromonospora palomenae]
MLRQRDYANAVRRWEGVGPYYAMFPTWFADDVISRYTEIGDTVLDPFAGRGTAIFSAACQGRNAFGVEINPVGWCYAKAKLTPGSFESVSERLRAVSLAAPRQRHAASELPEFFHFCFSQSVREFLLAARELLDWRQNDVDRTVMALLLVSLHGKSGSALSNQMRQTKAMAPDYAVRWWKERGMEPPDINPLEFMTRRVSWRYARGIPATAESEVLLGDAEAQVSAISGYLQERKRGAALLLTSPPYFGLTNYHYDQWLRLWLLGGPPNAYRVPGSHELQGKFENARRYCELLRRVFTGIAPAVASDGIVYVRTGRGEPTLTATRDALRKAFPSHALEEIARPYTRPTQTSLFGDTGTKVGEVDLIMTPVLTPS